MIIFFHNELTRNLEIGKSSYEFFPISGDWSKLETPNLARVSLMKYYYMLQKDNVTAFTISELLRENKHGCFSVSAATS